MTVSAPAIASDRLRFVVASPIALFRGSDLTHVERRMAKGEVVRVVGGIYAHVADWRALAPWHRYLARVHAVAMLRPDVVFCLESAAALWGLPVFGDPVTVHILGDARTTSSGSSRYLRTHATRVRDDVVDLGGILVTGRVTTAVDIARQRHHAIGLAVADATLRADSGVAVEQLVGNNEARLSSRGRLHARWPLERATALAESALESVSTAVTQWLGFAAPRHQVEFVTDGKTDRVDDWWEADEVIGEADGDLKYDGSLGTDPATVIRNEKDRDRRLLQHAKGIAHWGWSDALAAKPLRDSLLAAGLTPIAPENTAELVTLRQALSTRRAQSTRRAPSARQAREAAPQRRDHG